MKLKPGFLGGVMRSKRSGLGDWPVDHDRCCEIKDPRCSKNKQIRSQYRDKMVDLRSRLQSINWQDVSMGTERECKAALESLTKAEVFVLHRIQEYNVHRPGIPGAGFCIWDYMKTTGGTWHGNLGRAGTNTFKAMDKAIQESEEALKKAESEVAAKRAAQMVSQRPVHQGIPTTKFDPPPGSTPVQNGIVDQMPAGPISQPTSGKGKIIIFGGIALLGGLGLLLLLR